MTCPKCRNRKRRHPLQAFTDEEMRDAEQELLQGLERLDKGGNP
jgi:hypothetical protein